MLLCAEPRWQRLAFLCAGCLLWRSDARSHVHKCLLLWLRIGQLLWPPHSAPHGRLRLHRTLPLGSKMMQALERLQSLPQDAAAAQRVAAWGELCAAAASDAGAAPLLPLNTALPCWSVPAWHD